MKKRLTKKYIYIIALMISVIFQLSIYTYEQYTKNFHYETNICETSPIGEILEGTSIIQPLPELNVINEIEIQFATYSNTITSKLDVSIRNDDRVLFNTEIDGKDIKDNEYHKIVTNLKIDKTKPTYLQIDGINGVNGNSLTIWTSKVNKNIKAYTLNGDLSSRQLNFKINSEVVNSKILYKCSMLNIAFLIAITLLIALEYLPEKMMIKKMYKYRYYILCTLFFISVFILKINFSSFEAYKSFLPNNFQHQASEIKFGDYRGIRSDEWGVLTPLQLSQQANNYNVKTNFLGEDIAVSAISGGIPTKDASILGKPFLWGYILFGNDIGFSWYYVSKLILLLVFSYKLLYIITKNRNISILGSFIIAFSPGIQWWLTTNAQFTENVICLEIIVVSLYRVFSNTSKKIKYLNSLLLLMGMIGFTFVLYPPFQIPLFYLGISLLIGLYLDNKENIKFSKNNIILLVIVIFMYLIIFFTTIFNMIPEILKIMNTVYPGRRDGKGGTLTLEYLFNYLPSILLPFKEIGYSNSSEMSSFITLLPIPIIVYFKNKRVLKTYTMTSLIVYITISLIYMYIGFPKFLSKLTLMSMVTEGRLYTIFALACTLLLICISVNIDFDDKKIPWGQFIIYSLIIYYAYKNYDNLMNYLTTPILIIIVCFIFVCIYYLNNNGEKFIQLMLILTFISGVTINPVNFGIKEMKNTKFAQEVKMLNQEDNGYWITVDDIWLSKYMLAQGIKVMNALNYPPMLDTWGILDEGNEYEDIYNRYAHVKINLDTNKRKFSLEQTDVFEVNMTSNDLDKLKIKYIVSRIPIDEMYNLELIYSDDVDNILIYKNIY